MSVRVPNRSTSEAQFVKTARDLEQETRIRCVKAPKRYTFYGLHEFWLTSRRIHSCVTKANSKTLFYEKRYIKRRELLSDALCEIDDYVDQLGCLIDCQVLTETTGKVLSALVDKEENLIKAVLKSDKKRFEQS